MYSVTEIHTIHKHYMHGYNLTPTARKQN